MGFHLTYGAVLASVLSLSHSALALLLLVPVALVVAFLIVGRRRPQFRRAVPLLIIAVLVAFTLPLGLVPLQESAGGWQVSGSTLKVDSPPISEAIPLKGVRWSIVNEAGYQQSLVKETGFSDYALKTGTFDLGAGGPSLVALIYGPPAKGVLLIPPGRALPPCFIATPDLPALESALRQDSGPPTP